MWIFIQRLVLICPGEDLYDAGGITYIANVKDAKPAEAVESGDHSDTHQDNAIVAVKGPDLSIQLE